MEKSVFTKIINGEFSQENIIEETENYIALMDIAPINKGHVLIIPKEQKESLLEETGIYDDFLPLVHRIISIQKEVLGSEGANVATNIGKVAGQVVMHTHWHVIPRYTHDGLVNWTSRSYENDQERIDLVEKMKGELRKS